MSDKINSILLSVPVTMKIGPVPGDITEGHAAMSFGLQNFARILSENGLPASVDGKLAIGTFSLDGEPAVTQTIGGIRLDTRAFRVQPDGDNHQLEISTDLGESFKVAGNFVDYDFANLIGEAWVDGRIEKAAA